MLKTIKMLRIPTFVVLLLEMFHSFAQSDVNFLIYNVHKNRCLGDDLQELDICNHESTRQYRWTSENRIFNVAQKKCLSTGSKSEGSKLQWSICDANSDLQKWECQSNSLFGLKNESLYLSTQRDSFLLTLTKDPGDQSKWTIHGTMDSVCSQPYEELYTLKGNAFGRPCHFPFLYNNKWYSDCTTEGRSSNHLWCAIESEYEPNQLWGYCPTSQRDDDLWRKNPLTDVHYQVNEESALTWYQARKSCQQQGGDLLSIIEPHEQTFITGLTQNTGTKLWSGLNRLDVSSGWRWINGQPFRYLKWLSGQPSSQPDQSCGVISQLYDSDWSTAVCSERHGYICQRGGSSPTVRPVVHTGSCHSPWIPYSGHCYFINRSKRTWLEARDACRREGGDLLSIFSVEEQSFIISLLGYSKTDELWIGFNDLKTALLFEWSDHSSVLFALWDVNEPSHNTAIKEDCVLMRGEEGKWSDEICQSKYGYICKKKTSSDPSTHITTPGCNPGWVRYGYYCYLAGSEAKTFEEAMKMCEKTGSYLADITNRIENAFLVSLTGSRLEKYFWIGLFNQKDRHTFEWTNTKEVLFTHFNAGMPGGKQGCVAMTTGVLAGLWDVLNCTNAEKYICKKRVEGVSTTQVPSTTSAPSCSEGWYLLTNRDFCFKLYAVEYKQQKTWSEALEFCQEVGGDLLSIHSGLDIAENLRSYFPVSAWIGYSNRDPSVGFIWSDGSPSSYEKWMQGEPANFNNTGICGTLIFWKQFSKEEWKGLQCKDRNNWYCEIHKGVTPKDVKLASIEYSETKDGWIIFKDNEYYISTTDKPMAHGRSFCKQGFGDLVVINDEEERVFLWHQIKKKFSNFYIGLNIDLDKSLSWMDGSPVVFQAWEQNQPAFLNNDEQCVKMSSSQGLWTTINCGDDEDFICKRSGSLPVNATAAPIDPPKGGCASDWMQFQEKCYKIGLDLKTWVEARSYCRHLNGTLASINTKHQQAFLTSKMDDANMPDLWHGMNNLVLKRLRWTDGSPLDYTAWTKSVDDNIMWDHTWRRSFLIHSQDHICGAMGGVQRQELGKWVTKDCSDTSGYICSRAIDPLIKPSSTEVPTTFVKLGNSSYMIVQRNLTWKEAQHHCETEGANLASIRDGFTQGYSELQADKLQQPLWIGLNSMETDGYFHWIDKWYLNMEKWDSHEPKKDHPCVYVSVNGNWKTAQCNQTYFSLCKKSTDLSPTPPAQYLGVCPEPTEEEPKMTWLPYKGHCYAFVKREVSWNKASQMCMTRGANLVSILDPMEAHFLETYLRLFRNDYGYFWIGLFKTRAGHWLWVDESVVDYTNLMQTISQNEFLHLRDLERSLDCAVFSAKRKEWLKQHCEDHAAVICKTAKVVLTPTEMASTGDVETHRPFNGVSVVVVIAVLCAVAGLAVIYHRFSKN